MKKKVAALGKTKERLEGPLQQMSKYYKKTECEPVHPGYLSTKPVSLRSI